MLKKLKLLKKPLFQKRRWSCDFPPRKMPVTLKHRAISRQEKMAFSAPVGLSWDSPPPPTECADGRTYGCTDVRKYGCTDVRTDGHVTITSQPKFLGLIGYHISLGMTKVFVVPFSLLYHFLYSRACGQSPPAELHCCPNIVVVKASNSVNFFSVSFLKAIAAK